MCDGAWFFSPNPKGKLDEEKGIYCALSGNHQELMWTEIVATDMDEKPDPSLLINTCPVDQVLQIFEKKDCPSIKDKSNKKIEEYAERCFGIEGHNELRLELCCRDLRLYNIWIDGLRVSLSHPVTS